ncbi:hypothetical protein [Paenibacillus sp. YN15]|uniref:hypothetical protein n=1 Tax=Paenibacillus sp. YN15 TaxID=1742774 RepID=UPI0011BF8E14|nr:hypothetical protein [Paenibacillus sp. YN15]
MANAKVHLFCSLTSWIGSQNAKSAFISGEFHPFGGFSEKQMHFCRIARPECSKKKTTGLYLHSAAAAVR